MSHRPVSPRPAWGRLLRILGYVAGLLLLGEVLLFRIRPESAWTVFDEHGHLEITQVVVLGLAFLLGAFAALAYPRSRPVPILVMGLVACVLTREHNNAFKDQVGRGVWQAWVAGVALATVLVSALWWRNASRALADLSRSVALAWMAAAVCLIAFGQLLDQPDLWNYMLEGQDPKAARRAVEECFELAGYWLFMAGMLEYVLVLRRASNAPQA